MESYALLVNEHRIIAAPYAGKSSLPSLVEMLTQRSLNGVYGEPKWTWYGQGTEGGIWSRGFNLSALEHSYTKLTS